MSIILSKMSQRLAEAALVGRITEESATKICEPFIAELTANLDAVLASFVALNKNEPDWKLSLADGLTVTVKFSAKPQKAHLAAFVKVFSVMVESFVEATNA